MTLDEAKALLRENGYAIGTEKRLTNDTGTQIKTTAGQIVNMYDSGKFSVQGSDSRTLEKLFQDSSRQIRPTSPKSVFVVYGHDAKARNELEMILRRWGLEPLVLDQLPSEGQTIIEKLEKYQGRAEFAVVLATPDDEGHPTGKADQRAYRARQNVVLELGMMLAHLGRAKVAILLKDVGQMERPSDIQGLIYIPFTDSVEDAKVPLAKEMNQRGFNIPLAKL